MATFFQKDLVVYLFPLAPLQPHRGCCCVQNMPGFLLPLVVAFAVRLSGSFFPQIYLRSSSPCLHQASSVPLSERASLTTWYKIALPVITITLTLFIFLHLSPLPNDICYIWLLSLASLVSKFSKSLVSSLLPEPRMVGVKNIWQITNWVKKCFRGVSWLLSTFCFSEISAY